MPTDRRSFEVGFVLAGAISAGCYSAGVMDFLIEALDAYYAARDQPGWTGPTHDVHVPVLAGASAGGMTASMAALHLFRGLDHVRPGTPPPAKDQNRLYASWVTDISIERLLETSDLVPGKGLRSALCSDVLDEILTNAFDIAGPVVQRPWVGRNGQGTLRVMLTLTNLRGVPYSFDLIGAGSTDAFGMTNHADVGSFRLGVGPAPATRPWLDVTDTHAPDWGFFKVAALATGAFPVGLAPRAVARPASELLDWGTVGRVDANGRFTIIPPDTRFSITGTFTYWAIDGGTIDNEPLEQARRYLTSGMPDEPNGDTAKRAVVLIAPFPNYQALKDDPVDGTLATALPGLFSALINQARFKPEELAKAKDTADFSRFLISPVRERPDRRPATFAIASGALGGFSGFLHESFRRHDYLLGRRNAQAFLRWNFVLPRTNDLFVGAAIDERWVVRDAGSQTGSVAPGADAHLAPKLTGGVPLYPIIPLTPELQVPIEIGPADVAQPNAVSMPDLHARLRARVQQVIGTLVDVDFRRETDEMGAVFGGLAREGAKAFGTQVATRKAETKIADELAKLRADFP